MNVLVTQNTAIPPQGGTMFSAGSVLTIPIEYLIPSSMTRLGDVLTSAQRNAWVPTPWSPWSP